MKDALKNNKGFTIIELLAVISLLAIVTVTISTFFLNNQRAYKMSVDEVTVQEQAQTAMSTIVEKTIESKGIAALATDHATYYRLDILNADGTTMALNWDVVNKKLSWMNLTGDTTVHELTGRFTAFSVTTLETDPTKASKADFTITVERPPTTSPEPPVSVTLTNTVKFRNYSPT
ncbi:type II secretion system GspH family protein [Dehalobacter sp. DCM]|uniref:PilW family protein n=1 Tax=Dehalobacter sp. DCM TaxID=2907827 RepID=UPI003081CA92|nr:type II secretion system GspH family protein [Dehalobacter sp. DCM]